MSTYDPEGWTQKDILVVAKAYPQLSKEYIETVCTGGITKDGQWIRLYPIPFRYLPYMSQYGKYQWISVEVKKHERDNRPETYRPHLETLQVGESIGPDDNWRKRREVVLPLVCNSIEELQAQNRDTGVSMGLIKVRELLEFSMEKTEIPLKYKHRQLSLFKEIIDLEPMLHNFRYRFRCMGGNCKSHNMSIIDWEIGELYRKARDRGVPEENLKEYIAKKARDMLFAPQKETYFYLGTHRQHPRSFMIGGVFYYNRQGLESAETMSLFDQ